MKRRPMYSFGVRRGDGVPLVPSRRWRGGREDARFYTTSHACPRNARRERV